MSIQRHLAIIRSLSRPSRLWYHFFPGIGSLRELIQHGQAAVHPIIDLIEELEAHPSRFSDEPPAIQLPFWILHSLAFGPMTASARAQTLLFDVLNNIGYGDVAVEQRLRYLLKKTCENNETRVAASRRDDVEVSVEYKWSLTPFSICELLIHLFPEYSPNANPNANNGWRWPSKNIDDVLTDWKELVTMPMLHADVAS